LQGLYTKKNIQTMKHMKKIIIALSVLGLALCLTGPLSAQPLPNEQPGGGQTGGDPISGPSAPIGGGAGILVAFGVAYAISRYNKNKGE
jgi:hypothetical protein